MLMVQSRIALLNEIALCTLSFCDRQAKKESHTIAL